MSVGSITKSCVANPQHLMLPCQHVVSLRSGRSKRLQALIDCQNGRDLHPFARVAAKKTIGRNSRTVIWALEARSLALPVTRVFAVLNHRHIKTVSGTSTAIHSVILATLFHAPESALLESR